MPACTKKSMTHFRTQGGQGEAKEVLEGRSSPPLLTAAATDMSHLFYWSPGLCQQPDRRSTARSVGADQCKAPGSKHGPIILHRNDVRNTGRCVEGLIVAFLLSTLYFASRASRRRGPHTPNSRHRLLASESTTVLAFLHNGMEATGQCCM